jgi:hypothetical protein
MKTVTFDFDHTLLFEQNEPNEEGIAHFRKHMAAGDVCHVVTSRHRINDFMAQEIDDFLEKHELVAKSVVFTNGKRKLDTLQEMGSQLHFDDDLIEVRDCRTAGIEAVQIFNQVKWDEYMEGL